MGNELANRENLTAVGVREQVNLIQQVMEAVMQGPSKDNPEGVHYGIIPGTKKMTLLKPGAEKLAMTFRLRPIIDNDRDIKIVDMAAGHREITVYCHVFNMAGVELATGIGSCSTMESKYRYRGGMKIPTGKPVPKEYWNLKNEGKWKEAQELIGGQGFGTLKGDNGYEICELGAKMENPDIADVYNTVLKMAKKRAFVDGILSATAASDIFTQDEDVIPGATNADGEPVTVKQPLEKPQSKSATAHTAPVSGELRKMTAKFESKCGTCGMEIKAKDEIMYDSANKKAHHPECVNPTSGDAQNPTEF